MTQFKLHTDLERDGLQIGQFDLSLLLMINDAAYPWFVLVPKRENIKDMHQLEIADYNQLTQESRALSICLMSAFGGKKMNVAALGNMTPQLHVHHIVRFENDPAWPGPIWGVQLLTPMTSVEISTRRNLINQHRPEGLSCL